MNFSSISPDFRLKKMDYNQNMHNNSEDFKNLGTMHQDKRMINYYPAEEGPVAGVRSRMTVDSSHIMNNSQGGGYQRSGSR
jgi:hypothetical protein